MAIRLGWHIEKWHIEKWQIEKGRIAIRPYEFIFALWME
jgi:hypothetical protein